MANNSLEIIEREAKQYIVVMVGSEQYRDYTAISTISSYAENHPRA